MEERSELRELLLTRYLLRDLAGEDVATVEDGLARDRGLRERLDELRMELIVRYLTDDLSERERELFETRFLSSAHHRDSLAAIRAMTGRLERGGSSSTPNTGVQKETRTAEGAIAEDHDRNAPERGPGNGPGTEPRSARLAWSLRLNGALARLRSRLAEGPTLPGRWVRTLGGMVGLALLVALAWVGSDLIAPEQAPTMFLVRSLPSGATVSLDGDVLGATPLNVPVQFRPDRSAAQLRLALDGYDDYIREIRIEPGRTAYLVPTAPLTRTQAAPYELALEEALAVHARLIGPDGLGSGFDALIEEFQEAVEAVIAHPDAPEGDRETAVSLSEDLKEVLIGVRSSLSETARGSEAELRLLEAIVSLDPLDADRVRDRDGLLASRDQLKRTIEGEINGNEPANAAAALDLLTGLVERFPSERPYYDQQRIRIREGLINRLRTLCSAGIEYCEQFGQAVLAEFEGDAELASILDGAPGTAPAPLVAPVAGALPVDRARADAVVQATARLDTAFDEARYAEPPGDSCIQHATEVLRLTGDLDPEADFPTSAPETRTVRGTVAHAIDLRSECARLVLEDARSRVRPESLIDALASREVATGIHRDLELAGRQLQAALPYLSPESGAQALADVIGRWTRDLGTLLVRVRMGNVRHNHASSFLGIFGRNCDGELIIDGFEIAYDSRGNNDHDMATPLSVMDRDLPIDADGDFKFNLEQESSYFIDSDDPPPHAVAEELSRSIEQLRLIRARLSAEANR